MHGRLFVKWLGFVNSFGRSCFLEEIVIVVPRWFVGRRGTDFQHYFGCD